MLTTIYLVILIFQKVVSSLSSYITTFVAVYNPDLSRQELHDIAPTTDNEDLKHFTTADYAMNVVLHHKGNNAGWTSILAKISSMERKRVILYCFQLNTDVLQTDRLTLCFSSNVFLAKMVFGKEWK